ncbi:MAG: ATP-binding domain-containing protein [Deltaproteobacteria bacterium]|nr:ATP-binding domain-containing protein [Deltaproteobacteria bacterium]
MKPLCQPSEGLTIIESELRLLAHVSGALSQLSANAAGAPAYDEALVSLRDQLGEAKPEDIAALVEQMTRIAAIAQRYGKGRDLPVDPTSPYFAHIRLDERDPKKQRTRSRDVLIGKRGYIDRKQKVQIVDWRNAPVSRIYYRYEEGDDYEERFGNEPIEGLVEVRRNLTIDDTHLRRIGCPQGTFAATEDGSWVEAAAVTPELAGGQGKAARPPKLKRGGKGSKLGLHSGPVLRADKHLPEIAALIDSVQFELITHPESGLVVLQGGAGTGKTTVALHRVAYLNYQDPQRFRPDKILVVVPSRALVSYVERVLPSLGVKGVRVVTAERWLERTRQRVLPGSPKRTSDDTPALVLRCKKHPMMLELLRDFVAAQRRTCDDAIHKAIQGRPGAEDAQHLWRSGTNDPLITQLLAFKNAIRNSTINRTTLQHAESAASRLLRRAADLMADWSDALTDRELLATTVARCCPGEFNERQLDQVVSWCTRQSSAIEEAAERGTQKASDDERHTADGRKEGDDEREAASLDRPDDGLLLYLCWLKRGELSAPRLSAISYEHLVVDEAQDLAVVEMKALLEAVSEQRSVTIAGDTAQRLVFDNAFSDWESLLERLEMPAATNTTLELGYRSTREVMQLAHSLLGDRQPEEPAQATRVGAPVELHRFVDQGQAVAMLAEALRSLQMREPLASVALITRHLAQARIYYQTLKEAEVPSLRLVTHHDFSFKPGIEVCNVTQVKGLEFDYVLLLDVTAASYPNTVESRHLLHIAATRAAHQLWLVASGTPSPLLPKTL